MLALAALLLRHERIDSPRKLQTVLFLAQEATGKRLYRFRLMRGKVLSDDLDQDVAELEAIGMLVASCETETRHLEIRIRPDSAPAMREPNEIEELLEVASRLLAAHRDVLEGAATMCRLQASRTGSSPEDLLWFRQLNDSTRETALRLCKELSSSQHVAR